MAILAEKAGTPHLKIRFKLGISLEGYDLITISSNYTLLRDKKSIKLDHINALDGYLKRHRIAQDSPAWYLDLERFQWVQIY